MVPLFQILVLLGLQMLLSHTRFFEAGLDVVGWPGAACILMLTLVPQEVDAQTIKH